MMPINDPRDGFFYPNHTPKKDTYCLKSTKPSFIVLVTCRLCLFYAQKVFESLNLFPYFPDTCQNNSEKAYYSKCDYFIMPFMNQTEMIETKFSNTKCILKILVRAWKMWDLFLNSEHDMNWPRIAVTKENRYTFRGSNSAI